MQVLLKLVKITAIKKWNIYNGKLIYNVTTIGFQSIQKKIKLSKYLYFVDDVIFRARHSGQGKIKQQEATQVSLQIREKYNI